MAVYCIICSSDSFKKTIHLNGHAPNLAIPDFPWAGEQPRLADKTHPERVRADLQMRVLYFSAKLLMKNTPRRWKELWSKAAQFVGRELQMLHVCVQDWMQLTPWCRTAGPQLSVGQRAYYLRKLGCFLWFSSTWRICHRFSNRKLWKCLNVWNITYMKHTHTHIFFFMFIQTWLQLVY